MSGAERPLADEHEVVLDRIVQESLTNVVRHSSGNRVLIQLEHGAENLHVCVHDDGAGTEVPGSAGYGLAALADRLREVSGTLTGRPGPRRRVPGERHTPPARRVRGMTRSFRTRGSA